MEAPDLKQLALFLRVIEDKGIGRAARSLGVSQPHVSQDLKRLEKRLGHRLVERKGRSIQLTPDGEALVVFARSMQAIAERTRDYFSVPRVKGSIRIGLTEELTHTMLTRVLALFVATHPGFRLRVETSYDSQALLQGLHEGRFDLVVGKDFSACPPGECLWREPTAWFGRETTRGPLADPVFLVVPPIASELRVIALDRLNGAGRSWTITFQSLSYACLLAGVRAGFGVGPAISSLDGAPGTRILDDAGLPTLPDANLYLDRRADVVGVDEFATVVRTVLSQMRDETLVDKTLVGELPGPGSHG